MVANQVSLRRHLGNLVGQQLLADLELGIGETVGDEAEGDANVTFRDEVHFGHLLFLVVDDLVFFGRVEATGHEAKGHIV